MLEVLVMPSRTAVIFTTCGAAAVPVAIEKPALTWPAAIVTLGGSESSLLFLCSDMVVEAEGAFVSVTVQAPEEALAIVSGQQDKIESWEELEPAESRKVRDPPLSDALSMAVSPAPLLETVAMKEVLLCPARKTI
jgi:hypothetical protein